MTEMFSQQGEKVEFEKPVEAKGEPASPFECRAFLVLLCRSAPILRTSARLMHSTIGHAGVKKPG